MAHFHLTARFKRSALAQGTGLLVLALAVSALAAPDDKPKADANAAAKPVSPKIKTRKMRPGVKVNGGVIAKPLHVKKYKWVNGKLVEIYDGSTSGPEPTSTPEPPRVATGRRVRISARFVVTNAEDGYTATFPPKPDTRVELDGTIKLGDQTAFSWKPRDMVSASSGIEFTSKAMLPVVVRYDDPNAHFFPVKGKVEDRDAGSTWDGMWLASQNIDLLQIMDSHAEFLIKGDRNSESGDLYIRVTDAGEVFN